MNTEDKQAYDLLLKLIRYNLIVPTYAASDVEYDKEIALAVYGQSTFQFRKHLTGDAYVYVTPVVMPDGEDSYLAYTLQRSEIPALKEQMNDYEKKRVRFPTLWLLSVVVAFSGAFLMMLVSILSRIIDNTTALMVLFFISLLLVILALVLFAILRSQAKRYFPKQ